MKCELLNEDLDLGSIVKNITGTVKGKFKETKDQKYLKGSISEYSKNLIMTFPTLCDNTLPPSTASMISKANERNIVTMLELLFSSIQLNGTDGIEILSKIHKNIRTDMSLDDVIDRLESICSTLESTDIKNVEIARLITEMKSQLKIPQKSFPVESLSERSLNDYKVYNIHGKTVVKEDIFYTYHDLINMSDADLDDAMKRVRIQSTLKGDDLADLADDREADRNNRDQEMHDFNIRSKQQSMDFERQRNKREKAKHNMDKDFHKARIKQIRQSMGYEKDRNARETDQEKRDQQMHDLKMQQMSQSMDYERDRNAREIDRDARDQQMHDLKMQQMANQTTSFNVDMLSRQLLDTDIKKANEMVPTLMIIKYNELNTDGTIYGQKAFVSGVKSRLISVDSSDIVERMVVKNKTKVNFLNFIRATTGEIKLVKDFLLGINQAKIDAKNSVKKGPAAKMWKVLENRSIKNNWNKLKRKGNDASAITTLVINQETVNIMKKEYDFDIENIRNARMIFDAYNLLGIIIADESIEVVKFLYVGNDSWEQLAYSYLEKETNDNSYKKIINLLSKSGR